MLTNQTEESNESSADLHVDPDPVTLSSWYRLKGWCCSIQMEWFLLILSSPFSIRCAILINSILSAFVFVFGVNQTEDREDIFTTWAMGWKLDRDQYLIICYGHSVLLGLIALIFLMRFLTQLCYLSSTGTSSYYKPSSAPSVAEAHSRNTISHHPSEDNRAFSSTGHHEEYDRRAYADEFTEPTLSTIDSSELISADYAQMAQMREHELSADLGLPYIPKRRSKPLTMSIQSVENESPRSVTRSPNSEANLFDHQRARMMNKPLTKESSDYLLPRRDSHQSHADSSERNELSASSPSLYRRMSLLMYIWFRIPYDKHFRITCCIMSIAIVLQIIALSPNVLNDEWRLVGFFSTFVNVAILARITWSSSFADVWEFSHDLRNHLPFPRIFLVSYVMGVLSTNLGGIYLIFRIYLLHSETSEPENVSYSGGSSNLVQYNLNCREREACNCLFFIIPWWSICVLLNNENARFLDRYRKYQNDGQMFVIPKVPSFNSLSISAKDCQSPIQGHSTESAFQRLIALQDYKSYLYSSRNKHVHRVNLCGGFLFKSHYPWIDSVDGARPLIPVLQMLLLLSVEIGIIQGWNKRCYDSTRMSVQLVLICIVALRSFLLLISI